MARNAISRKKAREGVRAVVQMMDPKLFEDLEKDRHMLTWDDLVDQFVRGYGHQ